MDGKSSRAQTRLVLAAKEKGNSKDVESGKVVLKRSCKADRSKLPQLVAGREVLGRELSVFKNSKTPVWVKGTVKEFDEPSVSHKIRYLEPLPEIQTAEEEWLCLAKSMYMWADEDHICPFANPTFSSKHTPKMEAAVGNKVRMFWSPMGKWYQGKVVEYDCKTGKHHINFRDGDEKRCFLSQEAIVWLEIPELDCESAIKKMRIEEGDPIPVAVVRSDENQAPTEEGAQGSSNGLKDTPSLKGKSPGKAATQNGKRKPKTGNSDADRTDVQSQRRKVKKTAEQKSKPSGIAERTKQSDSGKSSSEAHTATSGIKKASAPDGIGRYAERDEQANGHSVEESKSASSSSREAEADVKQSADQHSPKKQKAGMQTSKKLPVTATQKAQLIKAEGSKSLDQGKDAGRKRSRLGLPGLAVSQQHVSPEPEAKRRVVAKAVAKPAKKSAKKAAEESRLGLRRQKTGPDQEFEEACQLATGARVGVWWEDDRCYYKGTVVSHDWYHKRLKILYDDGIEEFISPHKPETQFRWLTPRAQTAGATDAVHRAFQVLQAVNAVHPAGCGEEVALHPQATPAPSTAGHSADGSHLDALVPLRPSAGKAEEKVPGQHPAYSNGMPHPVDSTTRAQPSSTKSGVFLSVATPAAWPNGPLRHLSCTPGSSLAGLQAMVPPSSLSAPSQRLVDTPTAMCCLQAPALQPSLPPHNVPVHVLGQPTDRRFAMTPEPGSKAGPSKPALAPVGLAAEGWKVSIVFRGDKQIFQGRVLVYEPKKGLHHILWDDGEDEWVDISKEQLNWHADRLKTVGYSAGLPAGQEEPKGEELVGWRIAVYWKEEKQFYHGTVEEYDSELDQHTVSYSDGDELCESLCGQVFKFVLPPTVQAVGTRRVSTRKRLESSERDDADRRPRRRAKNAEDDDNSSDTEWGRSIVIDRKPIVRQVSQLQRETSTPLVTTPRACDIRRLNSKVGSLLVYEGEENHIDMSPGSSPIFSPKQAQLPELMQTASDPRGQPLIDRRISGLKCAQGFCVPIKRVRVYLPGTKPKSEAEAAKSAQQDDRTAEIPTATSLKQMLERVEIAQQSICKGLPAGVFKPTKDSKAPLGSRGQARPIAKPDVLEEGVAIPHVKAEQPAEPPAEPDLAPKPEQGVDALGSPVRTQQEEHGTPPPSPFATFAVKDTDSYSDVSDGMQPESMDQSDAVVPSSMCCDPPSSSMVPISRQHGSLSLPQTPSAASEGLLAPSRNGSIISAPLLVEIHEGKVVRNGLPRVKEASVENDEKAQESIAQTM